MLKRLLLIYSVSIHSNSDHDIVQSSIIEFFYGVTEQTEEKNLFFVLKQL